jgi:hypothetical protein
LEREVVSKTLADAVSDFGKSVKNKLTNVAVKGGPEDQIRAPLEALFADLSHLVGLSPQHVSLVGETVLSDFKIRPDYAVTVSNALVGFIEVKAPGKGADPRRFPDAHDKAQWTKLKSLPNLLYTGGGSFSLWRNGERIAKIVLLEGEIDTAGAKLSAPASFLPLISDFLNWKPEAPKNAKRLADVSARLCRLLRDEVLEQMDHGNSGLKGLANDWRSLLFPNADDATFADGYAQAVTFGLLIARAHNISLKEGIEQAAVKLRGSNSLIGTALRLLTENPDTQASLKTSLGTLLRVLDEVNWSTITKDKPDAWLYFYEDFLETYDNDLKKQTGSYYTPPEVVDAMTRLVDEALRGPLFGRANGLASSEVTIADPAVGTGTFLLGVLRKIAANVEADQGEGAVAAAITSAAKRIFGFELQFGPFAVAQLRLLAEMQSLTRRNAIADINLYVTNTLGNPFVEDEQLPQIVESLAKSRREANKVKRQQPITVVIGNPPYKNKAAGLGEWIESGSDGHEAPMKRWSPPPEWGVGAHTHALKNTYVYFWRWATLKVFGAGWSQATGQPDADRSGVVCFITAAGFLAGPAFQKMREDLRRDASHIWVIDCSPEGHQPEVATRIFPGVQQTICIVLAARKPAEDREKAARLYYMALPAGRKETKFEALQKLSLDGPEWSEGPGGWREPLLKEAEGAWKAFPLLSSLFAWSGSGVTPHRMWPIAPDAGSLEKRWDFLRAEKDAAKKEHLFHPDRDRHIAKSVSVDLGRHVTPRGMLANEESAVAPPVRYAFRSFDRQWIIPDHRLLSMARPKLWAAYSEAQIYLTAPEDRAPSNGSALSISSLIPDLHHYNGRGGRVYPLWADANATQPNIKPQALELLAATYGRPVSAQDAFAYIAAIMSHPAFTTRFAADLATPGLRLPLTADAQAFAEAVALGREVVWLHCYGERFADPAAGRPKGAPRLPKGQAPKISAHGAIPPAPEPLPDTMFHDAATNRLHVGAGYIDNVTPEMWAYEVSGKQILWQWFSYRRRDRTKPIIGDRRPPSPLEKIQPEGWIAEYTTDLLDLLNVLGRVIALHPAQAALLEQICEGPLISLESLTAAGLVETQPSGTVGPQDE